VGDLQFRVLGPLEALADGEAVPLGGAKQRAVLAMLLLHANEIVSVEQLIDEVWGDAPPQAAPHSLEAYVSRLRRVLAGRGPAIVRRGAGYSLELDDATLVDEHVFTRLLEEASLAAAESNYERVSGLAVEALALWRGPAFADVTLGPAGKAAAQRLEELRLRALEQHVDAELALGRHQELVGELQVAVGENPFRERFVAQLMLALYRSGRHADALELYERTRTAMGEDLGLQPSAALQQLSAQMVRQEPELSQSDRWARELASLESTRRPLRRREARAVIAVGLVGAAAAAMMAFTFDGSAAHAIGGTRPARRSIALVLPRAPSGARPDNLMKRYSEVLRNAVRPSRLAVETIVADEIDPDSSALDAVAAKLRAGDFDLVLWIGDGAAAQALAPEVRSLPGTTFVFLDASLATLGLDGVPNASAVRFADEQASELVGYLSGLVSSRESPGSQADVVSVVAGARTAHAKRVIAGYQRGIRRALPGAKVLVNFSNEVVDRTPCEQIANAQIDNGSDVVFATAGQCGLGALSVAATRGVWGVGDDELDRDTTRLRSRMLAHTYKEDEAAIDTTVAEFTSGTLPAGEDHVLGLDDDYAVGIWDINQAVTSDVRSRVVLLCSSIRRAHPRAS
jgi:DNA-binding SARP family transcriptional activator/basic membrane lipoprotein Med (substrate-binding protein (PBP1-ABC) superfamily)